MVFPTASTPLPSIHVVGDSISIQYGPHLEQYLAGSYHYSRKTGEEEALVNLDIPKGANAGDSSMVLRYLEACIGGEDFRPDLLLINCGLHDIKTDPATGQRQVSAESYRQNLEAIIALVRNAKIPLAWVRTTPSVDRIHNVEPSGFLRYAIDCDAYDAIALEVMRGHGVPVADLRIFTETLGSPEEIFFDHVHFTLEVQQKQAAFLAGWLGALRPTVVEEG